MAERTGGRGVSLPTRTHCTSEKPPASRSGASLRPGTAVCTFAVEKGASRLPAQRVQALSPGLTAQCVAKPVDRSWRERRSVLSVLLREVGQTPARHESSDLGGGRRPLSRGRLSMANRNWVFSSQRRITRSNGGCLDSSHRRNTRGSSPVEWMLLLLSSGLAGAELVERVVCLGFEFGVAAGPDFESA